MWILHVNRRKKRKDFLWNWKKKRTRSIHFSSFLYFFYLFSCCHRAFYLFLAVSLMSNKPNSTLENCFFSNIFCLPLFKIFFTSKLYIHSKTSLLSSDDSIFYTKSIIQKGRHKPLLLCSLVSCVCLSSFSLKNHFFDCSKMKQNSNFFPIFYPPDWCYFLFVTLQSARNIIHSIKRRFFVRFFRCYLSYLWWWEFVEKRFFFWSLPHIIQFTEIKTDESRR